MFLISVEYPSPKRAPKVTRQNVISDLFIPSASQSNNNKQQNTVGGENYAWEKFHEFREFSHSRETFPIVHFRFYRNQQ